MKPAGDWPLPGTQWTRFYLQPDRSLATDLHGGGTPPLALTADPFDPVPTIGGAMSSGEPVMRAGAYDQRRVGRHVDLGRPRQEGEHGEGDDGQPGGGDADAHGAHPERRQELSGGVDGVDDLQYRTGATRM